MFQWFPKLKFVNFMTEANPNNKTKTDSDFFLLDIVKPDHISFSIKNFLTIWMTFKIEIS